MSRRKQLIIFAIATLPVWVVSAGILLAIMAWQPPKVTTNVAEYPNLLKNWPGSVTNHFPVPVPASASNVRFSYQPGFVQGPSHLELHMTLPADEISLIAQHAAQTPQYMLQESGMASYPSHYAVYFLSAPGDRNTGVAVSTTANEVVFWASHR